MDDHINSEANQLQQDSLLFRPEARSEEDTAYFRRRLKEMHLLSAFDAAVVQFLANDAATIEQGEELLRQARELAKHDPSGAATRNANRVFLKVERLQSAARKPRSR